MRGIPSTRLLPTAEGALFHQQGFVGEVVANQSAFFEDLRRFQDEDEDEGQGAGTHLLPAGPGAAAASAAAPEEPSRRNALPPPPASEGVRGPGMIVTPEGYFQPAPPPPRPRDERAAARSAHPEDNGERAIYILGAVLILSRAVEFEIRKGDKRTN